MTVTRIRGNLVRAFLSVSLVAVTLGLAGCGLFSKRRSVTPTAPTPYTPSSATTQEFTGNNPSLPPDVNGLLAGQVVDSSNRRPTNAVIRVVSVTQGSGKAANLDVETKGKGYFTIEGLKPGQRYQLVALVKEGDRTLRGTVVAVPPNPRLLIFLDDSAQAEGPDRIGATEASPSSSPGTGRFREKPAAALEPPVRVPAGPGGGAPRPGRATPPPIPPDYSSDESDPVPPARPSPAPPYPETPRSGGRPFSDRGGLPEKAIPPRRRPHPDGPYRKTPPFSPPVDPARITIKDGFEHAQPPRVNIRGPRSPELSIPPVTPPPPERGPAPPASDWGSPEREEVPPAPPEESSWDPAPPTRTTPASEPHSSSPDSGTTRTGEPTSLGNTDSVDRGTEVPRSPAPVPSCVLLGRRLDNLALYQLDGKPWEFRRHRKGRLVLFDFWYSACGPCRRAIPHLRALQARYGSYGLQVVGIAYESGPRPVQIEKVRMIRRKYGMNYLTLLGGGGTGPCPVQSQFQVNRFPTLILIDETGKIVWRRSGLSERASQDLENEIRKRLGLLRR